MMIFFCYNIICAFNSFRNYIIIYKFYDLKLQKYNFFAKIEGKRNKMENNINVHKNNVKK